VFNAFFGRAMDLAIAAVVGFVMAIVGVAVLAVAAAWQLSLWMPWPGALAVTGVGVLAIAAIALWIGTAKKKKPEPEPEEQMSDADPVGMVLGLMELPVDVVKRIVMEKPIASIALISSVGLLIARKPEVALRALRSGSMAPSRRRGSGIR
jgi:membrane protein implicated in regulation of membrane protease activity